MKRDKYNLLHILHNLKDMKVGEVELFTRKTLPFFFTGVFVTTAVGATLNYLTHNGWSIGDWLINYEAGFIRRGFFGQCVFNISSYTGINAGLIVLISQLLFYLLFFIFSYLLLINQKTLFPFSFLILSPFIFLFQIYDHYGGYRKEIIYFAILSFLVWASRFIEFKKFAKAFFVILLIFPLIVLTHEMLIVFLPYVLIVYISKVKIDWKTVSMIFPVVLLSFIAFAFCVLYRGNQEQVSGIYSSLRSVNYTVGDGAISSLALTAKQAFKSVADLVMNQHYYLYTLSLGFSSIAFLPVFYIYGRDPISRSCMLLVAISLFGTIPLCAVALDWGRFIYIHLVSIFLILFLFESNSLDHQRYSDKKTIDIFPKYVGKKFHYAYVFIFWYLFLWYIPHCQAPTLYPKQFNLFEFVKPYMELVRYLRS